MKRILMLMTMIIAVPTIAVAQQAEKSKKKDRPAKQQKKDENKEADLHAKDREAIIKSIASYVDAFNAADARALAQHWSADGQWVNRDTGERVSGREAIQQQFAAMFAESESGPIRVSVDSVRFVTDDVAVEEGVAILPGRDGPSESSYTAIHVKEKGRWHVDSVRESVVPATTPASGNYEQLKELEWMAGQWVDQSDESTIETTCEWTKNRNFLTRSFKVIAGGQIDLEGTQVIGWDPVGQNIRSWVFDSDGGFGEGQWTKKGDRWEVKSQQTLAGGGTASSVNIITYVNENSFTWQSIGRQVDGEFMPNIEAVTVVRKPAE